MRVPVSVERRDAIHAQRCPATMEIYTNSAVSKASESFQFNTPNGRILLTNMPGAFHRRLLPTLFTLVVNNFIRKVTSRLLYFLAIISFRIFFFLNIFDSLVNDNDYVRFIYVVASGWLSAGVISMTGPWFVVNLAKFRVGPYGNVTFVVKIGRVFGVVSR